MGSKTEEEFINIKVLNQNNQVTQFKQKKTSTLKKLIHHFCVKNNLERSMLRFRFDGNKVDEDTTPKMLDMEDGDCIEVYQQQTGGVDHSV